VVSADTANGDPVRLPEAAPTGSHPMIPSRRAPRTLRCVRGALNAPGAYADSARRIAAMAREMAGVPRNAMFHYEQVLATRGPADGGRRRPGRRC